MKFLLKTFLILLVVYILLINRELHKKLSYINSNSLCDPFINRTNLFSIKIDDQLYPKSYLLSESINLTCLKTYKKKTKIILLWNVFCGNKDYGFGLGKEEPFIRNKCPITNCELTNDKRKFKQSDYVIAHIRTPFKKPTSKRPSFQRWIFALAESPMNTVDFIKYMHNNFFHLTATYRFDSNYKIFDSNMKWKINDAFNISFDFYSTKTNFAAAIISNCDDKSKRLDYIRKIQKYINVDIFGQNSCRTKLCPRKVKINHAFINDTDCKEIIANEYKFFFAFENSLCIDYVSEKFFHIIKFNIIPVVLGSGNYDYYVSIIIRSIIFILIYIIYK